LIAHDTVVETHSDCGRRIKTKNAGQTMMRWEAPPLTEPIPVQDIFATGRTVQVSKEFVRIIYYAEHPLLIGGPELPPTEWVVVNKVILPRTAYLQSRLGVLQPANTG
jgi:hypothetical protein